MSHDACTSELSLIGLVVAIGALAAGVLGRRHRRARRCPHRRLRADDRRRRRRASATTTASASRDYAPGRHVESYQVRGVRAHGGGRRSRTRCRSPVPLVFVFHGHGGSGANIERRFDIEGLWPDAIVVYPDGLVGHKGVTDPAGVETGWQTHARGER